MSLLVWKTPKISLVLESEKGQEEGHLTPTSPPPPPWVR